MGSIGSDPSRSAMVRRDLQDTIMGLRGEPSRDTAVLQPFLSFRGNRAMLANHFRRRLRVEYVFFSAVNLVCCR